MADINRQDPAGAATQRGVERHQQQLSSALAMAMDLWTMFDGRAMAVSAVRGRTTSFCSFQPLILTHNKMKVDVWGR